MSVDLSPTSDSFFSDGCEAFIEFLNRIYFRPKTMSPNQQHPETMLLVTGRT
jgi:hypothetical protein